MSELKIKEDTVQYLPKVNRVEVITDNGREFVSYDVSSQISLQDNGKTLKLFLSKKSK